MMSVQDRRREASANGNVGIAQHSINLTTGVAAVVQRWPMRSASL